MQAASYLTLSGRPAVWNAHNYEPNENKQQLYLQYQVVETS